MYAQNAQQLTAAKSSSAENHFPLLRRFSIASLVAMLATVTILILLYRHDQLTEHENISEQQSEQIVAHFTRLLGDRANTITSSSNVLDPKLLPVNPSIALLPSAQEIISEHDVLKLKIYNPSGAIVYSTVKEEIGGTSRHPDFHAKALSGESSYRHEFRKTFRGATGELHDAYVDISYMPLNYAGKRIGAIEIYRDATPVFRHLNTNTIRIPLIVFGVFALLYAALFFYLRRTDRNVAIWQRTLLENENRLHLLEKKGIVQTSLDGFLAVSTKDARIIDVNDTFCSTIGYSREELLNMSLTDLEAVESADETANHIKKIMSVGYDRFETQHRHKQGHLIDLEISVSHSELNGGVNYVFARDITERKRIEQALVAREQEYRSLAESSQDSIIRYDRDGRMRYLNSRLLGYFGLNATDVIGRLPREVWPDGRYAEIDRAIARAMATGEASIVELHGADAAGKLIFSQIHVIPERDATGQRIGTLAIGRDVSVIREAERKLRHFVDNLPGLTYTFRLSPDGHTSFPYVSPALEELYGLKPEDVKDDATPIHMLAHPDDCTHVEAAVAESARTMMPLHAEFRVCRPGKPLRWLEVRSKPEREADGSIIWYGIMLDITERKLVEAMLVQREHELRTLAESMPDNIVRYNREGVTTYVNPVLEQTLGDLAAAMIGTTPREYHPDGSYEDYAQLLDAVLASGEAGELEKIFPGPDGETSVHQIRMVPERGENGEVVGVLAIGRDITERKRAEKYEQFRSRTLELLASGASLTGVLEGIARGVEHIDPKMICSILLLDHQGKRLGEGVAPSLPDFYIAAIDGLEIGIGIGSCGTAAATGERVIVDDIQSHSYWVPYKELAASAGLGACWSEPIRASSGQVLGTFAIYHREPYSPTESDIALIEKSARLASIAIQRRHAEQALFASEQKFRSLAENMPDTLIRYDREGRRTYINPALKRISAVRDEQMIGLTQQESNPFTMPEIYRLALEHTLATGERSDFELPIPTPSGDIRTNLVFIVAERSADGQISGAITIGHDITERKRAEQRLRELTTYLQTVRDEEKAGFAREIHDSLGGTLYALKLQASLLEMELSADLKQTPLFERIQLMTQLLDTTLETTRAIINDLHPSILNNLGLPAAIKWQAEQFHKRSGIECRVNCFYSEEGGWESYEGKLDKKPSINLFRIYQEALANIQRHSGASRVEVALRFGNNEVVLSISDNGRGLPEAHSIASTSYGLRGMRERVAHLGGKIGFDSPQGGGFRVMVELPLSANSVST